MIKSKIIKISYTFLVIILLLSYSFSSYASTDIAKVYISQEVNNSWSGMGISTGYIALTFRRLGYNLLEPVNSSDIIFVTNQKSDVMSYLNWSSTNYAFGITSHGETNKIKIVDGSTSQYIYNTNVSGNWHYVILNCCLCLSNDSFAQAFHTTSAYSNRAIVGWFNTVTLLAQSEFWPIFYQWAGQDTVRQNCLDVASACANYTPTRFYGDNTWYGWAW